MSDKSIIFLINKNAGHGVVLKKLEELIHQKFSPQNKAFKIEYAEYQGHIEKLAQDAAKQDIDTIVVAGGDGSLNGVFKEIKGKNISLGIIPIGSGNGLGRHLNIPFNIEKALDTIINGKTKLIDTATINNIPFISIAGVGFDALIAKLFTQTKIRGFWAYMNLVFKNYFSYQPNIYHISNAENNYKVKAFIISFANSDQFGYNTSIAPQAKIDDGFLDVCILKKPPWYAIPIVGLQLLFNKINHSSYYTTFKSKKLTVEADENMIINIDGEHLCGTTKLTVKLSPKSLKVIIP